MRLTSLIATGLLLFASSTQGVAAPTYRLLSLGGNYVKWGRPVLGAGAEITYRLADHRLSFHGATNCGKLDPLPTLLDRSHVRRGRALVELKAAFKAWEAVANVHFRPARAGEVASIIIGAQVATRGRAFTNVAYLGDGKSEAQTDKALTSLSPDDAGGPRYEGSSARVRTITQSLICLNPDQPWKVGFDGNLDAYDLRYTFMHEIGHAIGLDHAGPRGEVMSFKYTQDFRSLQGGDRAGVVKLYGPPAN